MTTPSPTAPSTSPTPRSLARRLGVAFAMIVAVATAVCALLLVSLDRVTGYVRGMQHQEHGINASLELTTAIRELHLHAARDLLAERGTPSDDYARSLARIRTALADLRTHVDSSEPRLARIEQQVSEADVALRTEILVGDHGGLGSISRARQSELVEHLRTAGVDADEVSRAMGARMSHSHVDTTRVTAIASVIAGAGIVLLVLLAAWSTRRLRAAVLRPIQALVDAAQKLGRGDFEARVGMQADGELGVVLSAFDRMAAQLAEHQHRLVASERMAAIGQLAAGVAHEINNPIGVIRGYLRTMIPEATGAELKDELRILDEEAAACQRIAEDLVAYARAPDLARGPVELNELLGQTATRFETSGESKGCRVEVRADPCTLELDAVRMRQVLQNLLRNAVEASPTGARIEVSGALGDGGYRIAVADRGSGIPGDLADRIFEPFVSGKSGGTGLGLAVCAGIVRAHAGRIEGRPRDGGGSEFVVTLPLKTLAASPDGV